MIGFPTSVKDSFIEKLCNLNLTVVLIEQTSEPPKPKREITGIFSPATFIESQSLLNYVLQYPATNIDTLSPVSDSIDPVLYFYSHVGASASLDYITFNGATVSVPYDTSDGFTFSTTISLTQSGTVSGTVIDKSQLIYLLIDEISDNRDGTMSIMPSNLIISGTAGNINNILNTGSYSVTFNFSDIAHNYLDGVIVNLNITT